MSQLRRALDDPALVRSGHGGYTLALDAGRVDALRVVSLAADAPRGTALGRPRVGDGGGHRGARRCSGARSWSTPATATGSMPHRARLEEVRLGLLEDQSPPGSTSAPAPSCSASWKALVEPAPAARGPVGVLITALYRAGRQADALAAYQRVRRLLVDELGIEPGPALRDLEIQILRQSATLDTRPGRRRGSGPGPVVGNLPALSTPLVGRADDLAAVAPAARQHRLVTLVGPAGVGKTRLALEAARGPAARRRGLAGPPRRRRTRPPRPAAGRRGAAAHRGRAGAARPLAGAETVLVLDNCEHVVDGVAALVTRLLDRAPRLRILATSQVPLGVDGEMRPSRWTRCRRRRGRRCSPTARPSMRRRFALDDDTTAIVQDVCRSLDGLPLAIELAAARIRSLSVQEIARRLDDRFTLLRDPTSRRPERRRALAAAIAWSYDLLFPDDQRGLWALSCFSGGAPLAAAEHVLARARRPRQLGGRRRSAASSTAPS